MVCIRVGQNHTVDPENTDRIEILHGRIGAFLPGAAAAVHQIGPARRLQHHALALDMMEELRPCLADRFVLTLINNRILSLEDFENTDSGAVLLTDGGRKKFLQNWQERKRDTITHPYLGEKLPWGLVPYVQALLLARYLRGDLDGYPPFLWK